MKRTGADAPASEMRPPGDGRTAPGHLQRTWTRAPPAPAIAAALLSVGLPASAPAVGQTRPEPPGTYADAGVRALVERARGARARDVRGIRSYEGTLRQRIFVGITAPGFRRERGLFEMERVARLRWSEDGEHAIQWFGARTRIPVAGIDTGRPGRGVAIVSTRDSTLSVRAGAGPEADAEIAEDMARDMLDETEVPGFQLRPGGDRLFFGGDDWALHPLADTAGAHYRYAPGDTLRLTLPGPAREVLLHEVKVAPRRADFRLVAGSLWFDSESASLVRATYRPARPFDLRLDEPDDAEDVPGILQPIQAEIAYVTVEYSLHELRYWLPRRYAFEGEARIGGRFRIPVTLEWTVGDYSLNEGASVPVTGALPEGWRRRLNLDEDESGDTVRVTVIVPTAEELRAHPALSRDFGQRSPTGFDDDEIEQLRGELEGLLPTYRRFRPQVAFGPRRGLLRYNRVEGLSVGVAATLPLTPSADLELEARVGTADREPDAGATLRFGEQATLWSLSAYHRLAAMGDWTNPFGLGASVGSLVLGVDHGQFYRSSGASLDGRWVGRRTRASAGLFHERHRGVGLATDFFLLSRIVDHHVPDPVLSASDVDVTGVRGSVSGFAGTDPNALVVTGRLDAEVAAGGADYGRAWAAASASHPLPFGLAGALEVGAGALWGDQPLQRRFFLGGSATLRGFRDNELIGPAFWRLRGEVATGFAAARLALFGDAGWAGPRDAFRVDDPAVSLGAAVSLLDGLFRLDVARAVRRRARWGVHAYLDGLF